MKSIFLVGAKLLGLFSIFKSLSQIPIIAVVIGQIQTQVPQPGHELKRFLMISVVYFSIYLLFGLIMTFQTEKLSNLLQIKEMTDHKLGLPKIELFKIGINLLGIYILISALPHLVSVIYKFDKTFFGEPAAIPHIADVIIYGLQTLFGFVLVFAGRKVIGVISGRENKV